MKSAYEALIDAVAAIVRDDAEALAGALSGVPLDRLISLAARHKCLGVLSRGIATAKLRDDSSLKLLAQLKPYTAAAGVQSIAVLTQLHDVIHTFNNAGIQFVLLKSGARLYAGEPLANWTIIADLDILVRKEQARAAFDALKSSGYVPMHEQLWQAYLDHHHHLIPLTLPGNRKMIELHVALAPPGKFSVSSDWAAMSPHFETIEGAAGPVLALDAFGRAKHLVLHGAALDRLFDTFLLAIELRRDPRLVRALQNEFSEERGDPIGAHAALALACRVGGSDATSDYDVQRYLSWVRRRECLPEYLRDRTQFIDAWYQNGGRLFGRCTRQAVPGALENEHDIPARVRTVFQTVGRAFVSAAVAGLPQRYFR